MGCVLLYLNPGDYSLMMELLMFLIVGPAVINPLMELVEFCAELRNLAVCIDQIEDVMISEGDCNDPPVSVALAFKDVFGMWKGAVFTLGERIYETIPPTRL